ncbi:MAG: 16S rRNA (uracil(1498)-N(3))-methyltransferase [Chloroflexi bacterium]|nr:16S rRNA (uracil(1498)-N(3))-methyltransferase [Chloroflexota bacterium]
MHRFLVPSSALRGSGTTLAGPLAHQIGHVLRLRPGEQIVLFDGSGSEVVSEVSTVQGSTVTVRFQEWRENSVDAGVEVWLFPALIRTARFEVMLQKVTELGVARITPMVTHHTVVRPDGSAQKGMLSRWGSIVREATEQSGRARLPIVIPPLSFAQALNVALQADLVCCCALDQANDFRPLFGTEPLQTVALLIGPEGGWSQQEVEQVQGVGVHLVSLGRRTLRAETAAIAACAAVFCLAGAWNSGGSVD